MLCVFANNQHSTGNDGSDFFRKKVEPLLKEKCQSCHSHASGQMEGGLTLDSKSGWQTGGDRGPAIIPGNSHDSLLIAAIRYEDAELQMPPEQQLSDAEVAIFIEWINKGAEDPRTVQPNASPATDWWSLKPLSALKVPGDCHPVDAFIGQKIKEHELQKSMLADKVTLIRRLYVDLLGFLPTPQEIDSFVSDDSIHAYENLIESLLASPHYGERWARHWLDTIHFADSHGCEHDVKRPHAWRFRDYVIDRLNADVPWDRFIREQLAADVFYPNEPQLTPALGFIAAGPLELSRAGTAPITFDYLDRDDIVTQTMAAFVSSTANCARCHTHKFDPISQEDYYALQAVFAGVGKGDIEYDESAEVKQVRDEMESVLVAVSSKNASVLLQPKYDSIVQAWCDAQQPDSANWQVLDPEVFLSAGGATLSKQADSSVLVSGVVPDQETYTLAARIDLKQVTCVRLEVMTDPSLPEGGPGRAANGNMHLSEVEFHWFPDGQQTPEKLNVTRTSADFDQEGWTSAQAIDGNPTTGWAIFPMVNQSHQIVFELEKAIDVGTGGQLAIVLKQQHPPKHVIGRFRLSACDSPPEKARLLPASVISGLAKPPQQRSPTECCDIAAIALDEFAKTQLSALPPKQLVYAVSAYWSHAKKLSTPLSPKTVHLLRRGDIDKPVREVGPGALSAIDALPGRFDAAEMNHESARRAALANWIAHSENPLTWRSIVNRVWQYHFGRGLCDTANDFGRMGSPPTHPELLDWLAVWFRDEAKGSLKQLHRLILTSETWRRSSQGPTNEFDRDNRLLWRMNRQRMDAEVYRDSILRASGRLDLMMGGPGIEQFQKLAGPQATPTLIYNNFDWESAEAKRRSIYRVVWRGIADPFMESLDFPDLGLLAPKRGLSVSSLQALSLFNNDFVMHGSQWLAERVQREHDGIAEQVSAAVELAWLRSPKETELQSFIVFVEKHGMPAFCRVLFNSNEFLFVD